MEYEEIIDCPKTGGDLCYKIRISPEVTNYMSMSCGFWTNSLMKEGEEFYEQQMVSLPELYKDLAWKDDKTGLTWVPNTINEETKGMIFAMGNNASNWNWAAVRAIEIPEEERSEHPVPGKEGEFLKWRTDMNTMKKYHERDYIEALDYLGLLKG